MTHPGYYLFAVNGDGGQSYLARRDTARDELKKIFFGSVGDCDAAPPDAVREEIERWSRFCDPDYWDKKDNFARWTDTGEDYELQVFEVENSEFLLTRDTA